MGQSQERAGIPGALRQALLEVLPRGLRLTELCSHQAQAIVRVRQRLALARLRAGQRLSEVLARRLPALGHEGSKAGVEQLLALLLTRQLARLLELAAQLLALRGQLRGERLRVAGVAL